MVQAYFERRYIWRLLAVILKSLLRELCAYRVNNVYCGLFEELYYLSYEISTSTMHSSSAKRMREYHELVPHAYLNVQSLFICAYRNGVFLINIKRYGSNNLGVFHSYRVRTSSVYLSREISWRLSVQCSVHTTAQLVRLQIGFL